MWFENPREPVQERLVTIVDYLGRINPCLIMKISFDKLDVAFLMYIMDHMV